jgi:hypothetical protein
MSTLVTFGKAMVRLAPPGHRRLEQTTSLEVTVGGAELNVASGVQSTRPPNDLGLVPARQPTWQDGAEQGP